MCNWFNTEHSKSFVNMSSPGSGSGPTMFRPSGQQPSIRNLKPEGERLTRRRTLAVCVDAGFRRIVGPGARSHI